MEISIEIIATIIGIVSGSVVIIGFISHYIRKRVDLEFRLKQVEIDLDGRKRRK